MERIAKSSGDGYPPYNIEKLITADGSVEMLRITLAVAGFLRDQLDITLEHNQLMIRGRQEDQKERIFLHRGIAARQFQKTFVLADGIEVRRAHLENGLLEIDVARPEQRRLMRRIEIGHEPST